ncbi:MAG: ComEC/Rec2 family competence protein [Clostridia bacterium]|nr:ComEC/Rec2 family competence protein [Clostridia bacterium]
MALFDQRPLCLFCFLFYIASLLVWRLPMSFLIPLLLLTAAALCFVVCWMILRPQSRLTLLSWLLGIFFIGVAMLNIFLSVDLPQRRAAELEGERRILAEILDERESGYRVKLLETDGEKCSGKGILYCDFDEELRVGDRVLSFADLRPVADLSETRAEEGIVFSIYIEQEDQPLVQRLSEERSVWELLKSNTGRRILASRVQDGIYGILTRELGDRVGYLSGAFLLGDTAELSDEIVRDFRRSGTSHLMAISGMHITVLLGGLEWLLIRLWIPKKLRCVIVALFALGFLFVTGFSMSACRSVLMLFSVYLSFMFYEENDSVTALFASVTVILLIFPYGVSDLGLWMSFLATLGILTVYPVAEKQIPYSKNPLLRFLRKGIMLLLMTVVANLFLLPIMWAVFGEISWIGLVSNILMSPLADLILVATVPLLLLHGVPFAGDGIRAALSAAGEGLLAQLRFFSGIPYGTLSLDYSFSYLLIPLFSIATAVLLVVRLEKKRWLAVLPLATVLGLALCLTVYHSVNATPRLVYANDGKQNEIFAVEEGITLSVCDCTSGGLRTYSAVKELLSESHATEIHSYVLSHYHGRDVRGLELLLRKTMIHTLYLPAPTTQEEAQIASRLFDTAEECGTRVVFTHNTEGVRMTDSVALGMTRSDGGEDLEGAFVFIGEESSLTYLSSEKLPITDGLPASQGILIGNHDHRIAQMPAESSVPVYNLPRERKRIQFFLP